MRRWCDHYRGMHETNSCEVGVVFAELPGYGTRGFMDACPCFGPDGEECSKAKYPSDEEMAAREALARESMLNMTKAAAAIAADIGGDWKRGDPSVAGAIDCPVCGSSGALSYSRAGYNGHLHARCKTDGCVSWMS